MLNVLWYILFQFICLVVVFGFGWMYEEIKGANDWKTIVKLVFIILLCQLCAYESASGAFAEMASGYFNRLVTIDMLKEGKTVEDIENQKLIEFDCRAWNVPSYNDAVAWLLFRQIDCVRNSKQQTAQTYLSHKQLMNKDTDEQIKLLLDTVGVDWNKFNRGEKYGRFIYRKEETYYNAERNATYIRRPFCVFEAPNLMDEDERQKFLNSNIIPKRD